MDNSKLVIKIPHAGRISRENSIALDELGKIFELESSLIIEREKTKRQLQEKDGGLTVAIAVGGLIVSSIGTIVNVLSFFHNKRPKYKLIYKDENRTVEISNLSAHELKRFMIDRFEEDATTNLMLLAPNEEI